MPVQAGDEVWFKLYRGSKGLRKWKEGIILSRGEDILAKRPTSGLWDIYPSHHCLIWDTELEYITSRDRCQLMPRHSKTKKSAAQDILERLEKAEANRTLGSFIPETDNEAPEGDRPKRNVIAQHDND